MALHEQSVAEGDKVTFYSPTDDTTLVCGYVVGHTSDGLISLRAGNRRYCAAYEYRGIAWTIGHVKGTPAGEALRATYAMWLARE